MTFSPEVYEQIRKGAQDSAAAVVPVIYDLVKPETVVDVGGGEGWWAHAFVRHEVEAVVLDESVEIGRMYETDYGIPRLHFVHFDLTDRMAQPVPLPPGGQFDLAVCLEVAEHLDEESGARLVDMCCKLAPVVLWSAAIPNQGGHGHVNEQWPAYWASLFYEHGYRCVDCLRPLFWEHDDVEPWYRQNMLIFASAPVMIVQAAVAKFPRLSDTDTLRPLPLVHPDIYGWRVDERDRLNAILSAMEA